MPTPAPTSLVRCQVCPDHILVPAQNIYGCSGCEFTYAGCMDHLVEAALALAKHEREVHAVLKKKTA